MENNDSNSKEQVEQAAPTPEKVKIEFIGSEHLRAKIPQAFEIAETVATDWKNDGNFEGLPLGNPLAQAAASTGLKKAKDLEKKASFFAQVGIELVKSKLKKK